MTTDALAQLVRDTPQIATLPSVYTELSAMINQHLVIGLCLWEALQFIFESRHQLLLVVVFLIQQ